MRPLFKAYWRSATAKTAQRRERDHVVIHCMWLVIRVPTHRKEPRDVHSLPMTAEFSVGLKLKLRNELNQTERTQQTFAVARVSAIMEPCASDGNRSKVSLNMVVRWRSSARRRAESILIARSVQDAQKVLVKLPFHQQAAAKAPLSKEDQRRVVSVEVTTCRLFH